MKLLAVFILASMGFGVTSFAADSLQQAGINFESLGDSCSDTEVIKRRAALYKSSSFRCSYSHELSVTEDAEEGAMATCYSKGYTHCEVRFSHVVANGYLGYQEDFGKSLGYGCIAEAIIHARR